jgi:glycosyltransferase 2 family protein
MALVRSPERARCRPVMAEASPDLDRLPEPGPSVARPWLAWGRWLLLVVVALFVLMTLYRLGRSFRADEVVLNWPLLVLTTVSLVITNLMQAMAWVRLLNRMTHRVLAIPPILSGFMAGQLARYIPSGKVALLVVRTAAIAELGLSTRLVASSIGIEVLSWLTVGMLTGTLALGVGGGRASTLGSLLSTWSLGFASLTVLGILALVTVDRRRFPKWALNAIHTSGEGPILSLPVLGWQLGSWGGPVLQGLFLPMAVGTSFSQAWPNVGMFLLAPIAGFLAIVAPGGLGVREAVLSYALAAPLGASRALAVALLARASFVISEVFSYFIARWLSRTVRS